MSFILRSVRLSDLNSISDLSSQFSLLNLPSDKKVLKEKIERSQMSFSEKISAEESEYLFVVEDLENELVAGTSLILGKHGTNECPHYYFKIIKKDRFSDDLGIGFIHQVLKLCEDLDGPTEIGGLLIDKNYRRRPERLGRQISLIRFLFMGMKPERFQPRVLCELTPPLAEHGRSEFWEALGRRFTGLPYREADLISQRHKEFIRSLFPEEDIYLTLLDSRARLVLGRVGQETRPAQHLLESIGFEYLNEVDPFDGGPHFGAPLKEIKVVREGRWARLSEKSYKHSHTENRPSQVGLVGGMLGDEFRGMMTAFCRSDDELILPPRSREILGFETNVKLFYFTFNGGTSHE